MKLNATLLLLVCSLAFIACDDSGNEEVVAGEMSGGEAAGETAGETPEAGETAGDTAGETPEAGETAGETPEAGETAGDTAGDTAGTMMANVCNEVIEVGASCDPMNDCCARGSACAATNDEGTEGQCFRGCEIPAEGEAIGCEARELCIEVGEPGDDGVTPGLCLPGDDCEPGNEALACGEGNFVCNRRGNISQCIDLAEAEGEGFTVVGEGEECLSSETNPTICGAGLVCESNGTGGVCRRACGGDTDCSEGETCLDYSSAVDGVNYKFCAPVCDLANPDCGENGACVITDILDDVAYGTCREVPAEELSAAGEACNIFDDEQPRVFCAAGNTCEFNGVGYVCNPVCNDMVMCAEGETCVDATERYNESFQYNFCTTPCDPLAQDCADGAACAFSGVFNDAPGGTCVAEPVSGMGQNGDDCTRTATDSSYWGDCAANNVCFIDDEATGAGSCGSFCAEGRSDLCTGDYQACTDSAIEGLGLCTGQCDIYSDAGCEAGSSCLFGNEGPNAEGNLTATGFCEENPNAGQVGTEEVCVMGQLDVGNGEEPFDYPFLNNCPAGHICIGVAQGQPPICLQMCDQGAAENTCADGLTCQGLFQGIESVGVCFQ